MADQHPLIVEFFKTLPQPGQMWPHADRALWLNVLCGIFDVLHPMQQPETPKEPPASKPADDQVIHDMPPVLMRAPRPAEKTIVPRPEGTPTTFEMVRSVLQDVGDAGLTPEQIANDIASRYWPGLQLYQIKTEFYAFVTDGRLARRREGWLALTQKGRDYVTGPSRVQRNGGQFVSERKLDPQAVIDREAAKRSGPPTPRVDPSSPETPPAGAPAEKPKLLSVAISPTDDGRREFEHAGKKIALTVKEWRFVSRLYSIMGQGILPYQAIVAHCLKGERMPPDARLWCGSMAADVRDRLQEVGLETYHFDKQGYRIREIS